MTLGFKNRLPLSRQYPQVSKPPTMLSPTTAVVVGLNRDDVE